MNIIEKIESELNKERIKFEEKIHKYAKEIFIDYIKPYLIENKYSFYTGMGLFAITNKETGNIIKEDGLDKTILEILDILDEINGYPIGALMPSFNCRDYDFKKRKIV